MCKYVNGMKGFSLPLQSVTTDKIHDDQNHHSN